MEGIQVRLQGINAGLQRVQGRLEGVHNGSEAMSVFPRIQSMPPEEQAKARENLLAYCRLDTLAMVKVWEALKKAVTI